MVREYEKITDKTDSRLKWNKAVAFDNIVSHILQTEAQHPGSSFSVKLLNTRYTEQLQQFGVLEKVNTMRFTERLVTSIPVSTCGNNR